MRMNKAALLGLMLAFTFSGYTQTEMEWVQLSNTIVGAKKDRLGENVSIARDGMTVVATAPGKETDEGSVRGYRYHRGSWQEAGFYETPLTYTSQVVVNANGKMAIATKPGVKGAMAPVRIPGMLYCMTESYKGNFGDNYGTSIAMSSRKDNTGYAAPPYQLGMLAVGATQRSTQGKGYVMLYEWTFEEDRGYLRYIDKLEGSVEDSQFGYAVVFSGDESTLLVHANTENRISGGRGQIHVFQKEGDTYSSAGTLVSKHSHTIVSMDISMYGSRIVVLFDDNENGYIQMYESSNDGYQAIGDPLVLEDGNRMTSAITLDETGNTLAVAGVDQIYIYDATDANWKLTAKLFDGDGKTAYDLQFSKRARRLVAGFPKESDESGNVMIFQQQRAGMDRRERRR